MKPHPRIRKTVKWGGAVVSVLLLVVWVGSGWWCACRYNHQTSVGVRLGVIDWNTYLVPMEPWFRFWQYGPIDSQFTFQWSFRHSRSRVVDHCVIPLWAPTLLCLIPSIIAWRLDTLATRRARIGLCPKCNYDRAGLPPQAVCPECGTARASV